MSARARVLFAVALAALAAAAIVVGGAALSGGRGEKSGGSVRPGAPPLVLELGVRADSEAAALRRAARLYERGKRARALAIFDRYESVEARVGAALAVWPGGTLARLQALRRAHPHSALVGFHLGVARYWSGRTELARRAWRAAKRAQPDSAYALRADTLLHPRFVPGVPIFVPSFPLPRSIAKLPPREQVIALEHRATSSRAYRWKLLYGVFLQQLGHQLSAERQYAAAAARAPNEAEARVAAAVGRFDKDRPEQAFAQLGPLVRRFPRAATVRFHLGLLLAWIGQVSLAKRELRLAAAAEPSSPLAREAKTFLERLASIRTN